MPAQDKLTAALCLAVRQLTQIQKAGFLLNTALALIEDGQYGEEIETYLDVVLETPGLPKEDMDKALLARSRNAQKLNGGRLQLDPLKWQVQSELPPCKEVIRFSNDPASRRIPPEIWDQIAAQLPRYHLRKWLFVSPLHREIASRHIFHSVDIRFLEFDDFDQGLDFLDRVINNPIFASRIKSLRLRWDYEEGDAVDILFRILNISLPAFKALRDFEWVGSPEIPDETEKVLLNTHKCLHGVGFRGPYIDTAAVPAFRNLHKFTFCTEDKEVDLSDIRTLLDTNESTLKQLTLTGCPDPDADDGDDSLDIVFGSDTINKLTHLNFFCSQMSGLVIHRIAHAHNLRSLALHGSFLEPDYASSVFLTDTDLPHLESFRFIMEDQDEDLYESVIYFLRKKEKLRRLDLGGCPWDMIEGILPRLRNLRVLAVSIDDFSQERIESLVKAIPTQMVAIKLWADASDKPLDEYAHYFTRFNGLSFLHLLIPMHSVKPGMFLKDFEMQTDKCLRSIATTLPSLDFLAYSSKLYVIVRSHGNMGPTVELKKLPTMSRLEYGSGVDVDSEDIAWLQQKDVPTERRWNCEE